MKVIEAFEAYSAISAHFRGGYDYFKYGGKIRIKTDGFEHRKDLPWFSRIAKEHDPVKFIAANFIFASKQAHISSMSREHWLEFEKYITNGPYLFEQDLAKLKPEFNDNFSVDNDNAVPYIIELYLQGEISFHTLCVFETLLGLSSGWKKSDSYIIYSKTVEKVIKSAPFFEINKSVYKTIVLRNYSV